MLSLLGVAFGSRILHKVNHLLNSTAPRWIVTLNPEILLLARKDFKYRRIINSAPLVLVDGIGIVIMARLCYGVSIARLTGVDAAQELVTQAQAQHKSVLLVGGAATANNRATNRIGIEGFGGDFSWEEAYARIIQRKPDVLLVAMGAPKQEQFIHRLFTAYPQETLPSLAMGVGGAVDFWARPGLRAPSILRRIGMEWAWRLTRQPWRLLRIIKATVVFPLACLKERILLR